VQRGTTIDALVLVATALDLPTLQSMSSTFKRTVQQIDFISFLARETTNLSKTAMPSVARSHGADYGTCPPLSSCMFLSVFPSLCLYLVYMSS